MTSQGASANDTKSGREAIGRSRGGLPAKIHLAADLRYDKRERIYQGTIGVASISIWLRNPVP